MPPEDITIKHKDLVELRDIAIGNSKAIAHMNEAVSRQSERLDEIFILLTGNGDVRAGLVGRVIFVEDRQERLEQRMAQLTTQMTTMVSSCNQTHAAAAKIDNATDRRIEKLEESVLEMNNIPKDVKAIREEIDKYKNRIIGYILGAGGLLLGADRLIEAIFK